jgi:hypothetical protein
MQKRGTQVKKKNAEKSSYIGRPDYRLGSVTLLLCKPDVRHLEGTAPEDRTVGSIGLKPPLLGGD